MFTEKQRQIFCYRPDGPGGKEIFADPSELEHRISHYLPESAKTILRLWHEAEENADKMPPPEARFEATNQLVDAVRKSFRMTPWNLDTGQGASHDDCLDVWDDFQMFLQEKKNGEENSPAPSKSGDGITPSQPLESTVPITQPITHSC